MKIIPIAVAALLLLTGCAEVASRALTDAADLHAAARGYVIENHDFRRWVRDECESSLRREIEALKKTDGNEAEVRTLLRESYPPLVSIGLVSQALEDPSKISTVPFGCGAE